MASLPVCDTTSIPGFAVAAACALLDPATLKPSRRSNHRAPLGELSIGIDEKRRAVCTLVKADTICIRPPSWMPAQRVRGTDDDEGKDRRYLRIARREKGELLGAQHDLHEVADHPSETIEQLLALVALAAQEGDLLGLLPHPNEVEAEVRFESLLPEVEADQRPADQVGQRGSNHRIEQSCPDQVAGNDEARANNAEQPQKASTG